MSKAFDLLSEALTEAIEDVKGNSTKLKRTKRTIKIEPIRQYSPLKIKSIRYETGLTQVLFAQYLGVSPKTVEAWEAGRNKPSGSSSRLLSLLDDKKISIY
ncbi:helix-turn-helix domain-containing protein [Megamonas sp.]